MLTVFPGLNPAMSGMGIIVIILIAVWVIIAIENRIISRIDRGSEEKPGAETANESLPAAPEQKRGRADGEALIEGTPDDELVAVILAAVSEYADIPMNELRVRSIRAAGQSCPARS